MHITEPERQTPLIDGYDLIVCGGGPAGIATAVTAGRLGLRTLLIESEGCLGGVWTSGLICLVLDAKDRGGLLDEIRQRLSGQELYPVRDRRSGFLFDPEGMKVLLEDLCQEAKVDLLFHTRLVGAVRQGDLLKAAITESHGHRQAFGARLFVDCTGNGDLAYHAQCRYDVGHPVTGRLQPASLSAVITGLPPDTKETLSAADKAAFCELLRSVGVEPSYQKATLCRLPYPDMWIIGINHEYNVRYDSNRDITNATIRARKEIYDAIRRLRSLPEWKEAHVVATSPHLAIREGRRIRGHYTVTKDDLLNGQRWDDGVCLVRFPVDIHALEFAKDAINDSAGIRVQPYHIPYRALVSLDVRNLAMAGRCISGDFFAHASYRVTGVAVPLGEAVGIAAQIATCSQQDFASVDGSLVSNTLRARGHVL